MNNINLLILKWIVVLYYYIENLDLVKFFYGLRKYFIMFENKRVYYILWFRCFIVI